MPDLPRKGYNVFAVQQDINFNRIGTKVFAKGLDGTNTDSNSVEANLLFEILKELRQQNRKK